MYDTIRLIFIILALLIGGGAIVYFYFSADIFTDILKKPLKIISVGMLAIDLSVVMVVFISYESSRGVDIAFFGIPLSMAFYVLYFIGAITIIFGSRKFTHRP